MSSAGSASRRKRGGLFPYSRDSGAEPRHAAGRTRACALAGRSALHAGAEALRLDSFENETGNAEAVQLLTEFHHAGRSVPFLLLTENADETTVAALIPSGM